MGKWKIIDGVLTYKTESWASPKQRGSIYGILLIPFSSHEENFEAQFETSLQVNAQIIQSLPKCAFSLSPFSPSSELEVSGNVNKQNIGENARELRVFSSQLNDFSKPGRWIVWVGKLLNTLTTPPPLNSRSANYSGEIFLSLSQVLSSKYFQIDAHLKIQAQKRSAIGKEGGKIHCVTRWKSLTILNNFHPQSHNAQLKPLLTCYAFC